MIGLEEVRGKYLYPYLLYTYVRFLALGKCAGFPLVLQVQTHSACNGRCLACPYGTVSKRLDQGTMEWSLFERIAQQAVSEPFLQAIVLMLQNEPLLDKRVFDCVKYIKSTGRGKFCAIVTNGAQLDAFSPTDMVQSGLDLLVISLDAHSRETYERLHSGLSYDRVIKNISSVLSNESLRQRVCLSFLGTRHNLDEVRIATRYWNSQGVKTRVIGVANRAGALEGYEGIAPESHHYGDSLVSSAWGHLMHGAGMVTGCAHPFNQMNILFNGDCIVCCHDWNRSAVVGNAGTTPLKDIWNSQQMSQIRRRILGKQYDQIDACKECSQAR